jgi:hypothetical protein
VVLFAAIVVSTGRGKAHRQSACATQAVFAASIAACRLKLKPPTEQFARFQEISDVLVLRLRIQIRTASEYWVVVSDTTTGHWGALRVDGVGCTLPVGPKDKTDIAVGRPEGNPGSRA